MITLWHKGSYHDAFFNTLNDAYFMEVSMINLGFEPLDCEWVEFETSPNGHNPKKISDSDKSVEWLLDEIVPTAIITNPEEIPAIAKTYYSHKAYQVLSRTIRKQNEVLAKYLLPEAEIPPIPEEFITQTVVENKVVMNQMKKMIPTEDDFIFKAGKRLKRYSTEPEGTVIPKFDSLKSMATYLLSTSIPWKGPFAKKLQDLKGIA
jgi:hypothetical protein